MFVFLDLVTNQDERNEGVDFTFVPEDVALILEQSGFKDLIQLQWSEQLKYFIDELTRCHRNVNRKEKISTWFDRRNVRRFSSTWLEPNSKNNTVRWNGAWTTSRPKTNVWSANIDRRPKLSFSTGIFSTSPKNKVRRQNRAISKRWNCRSTPFYKKTNVCTERSKSSRRAIQFTNKFKCWNRLIVICRTNWVSLMTKIIDWRNSFTPMK